MMPILALLVFSFLRNRTATNLFVSVQNLSAFDTVCF